MYLILHNISSRHAGGGHAHYIPDYHDISMSDLSILLCIPLIINRINPKRLEI